MANSVMNYEKGFCESAFFAQCLHGGENTIEPSPQKDRYQEGLSFFFTLNLVYHIGSFAYSWVNTLNVKKLGYKLSLFIAAILFSVGLIIIMFIKDKYACMNRLDTVTRNPNGCNWYRSWSHCFLTCSKNILGSHLAILNSFNVIQIAVNVIVGLGLENLWDFEPKLMIGSGIVGGVISVIMSWFIIVSSREIGNSDDMNDEDTSGSDNPNSL